MGVFDEIDAEIYGRAAAPKRNRDPFADIDAEIYGESKPWEYSGPIQDVPHDTRRIATRSDEETAANARQLIQDVPNIARSTPGLIRAGLGKVPAGLARFLSEDTSGDPESSIYSTDAVRPGFGTLGDPTALNEWGTRQAAEAQYQEDALRQQYPVNSYAGKMAQGAAVSIGQQGPGILLAAAGMPSLGLPLMGIQTFGQTYSDSRDRGMSPEDAATNAVIQGGAEVGTELLPFAMIARAMKGGISKVVVRNYLLGEQFGEFVAAAVQNASDISFDEKDPEKRWSKAIDYWLSKKHLSDQVDTFWQTLAQSMIMGAGGKVAQGVKNRVTDTTPPTSQQMEEYDKYIKDVADAQAYEHFFKKPAPVQPTQPAWLTERMKTAEDRDNDTARDVLAATLPPVYGDERQRKRQQLADEYNAALPQAVTDPTPEPNTHATVPDVGFDNDTVSIDDAINSAQAHVDTASAAPLTPGDWGLTEQQALEQQLTPEEDARPEWSLDEPITPTTQVALSPEQRKAEEAMIKHVSENTGMAVQQYLDNAHRVQNNPATDGRTIDEIMANGPVIVNTDEGRVISDDYRNDPGTHSLSSHAGAKAVANLVWRRALATPDPRGGNNVLVLGGGGGSGKGSAMKDTTGELQGIRDAAQIVYDTTLSNPKRAVSIIEDSLAAGKTVTLTHVFRRTDQAVKGVVDRKLDTGRDVPTEVLADDHYNAGQVFLELAARYANNPDVQFIAIDNTGHYDPRQVPLDKLPELLQTKVEGRSYGEYQAHLENLRSAYESEVQKNGNKPLHWQGESARGTTAPTGDDTGAGGAGTETRGELAEDSGRPLQEHQKPQGEVDATGTAVQTGPADTDTVSGAKDDGGPEQRGAVTPDKKGRTTAKYSQEDREAAKALSDYMAQNHGAQGGDHSLVVAHTAEQRDAVELNQILTGKPALIIRRSAVFNGAHYKGRTFIDASSPRPILSVLGHEIGHDPLIAKHPDYIKTVKAVMRYLNPKAAVIYRLQLAETIGRDAASKQIYMEIFSDLVATRWYDEGFWKALFAKSPSLGQAIGKTIDRLLTKKTDRIDVSRLFTDLEAVKAIIDPFLQKAITQPRDTATGQFVAAESVVTVADGVVSPGPAEWSLKSMETWENALTTYMRKNNYSEARAKKIIDNVYEMKGLAAILDKHKDLFPHNPQFAKDSPLRNNSDKILYIKSLDLASSCVKRLEYGANLIELYRVLGKHPSADDAMLMVVRMREAGKDAPCVYCYVESPRRAFVEEAARYAAIIEGTAELKKPGKPTLKDVRAAGGSLAAAVAKKEATYKKDMETVAAARKAGFKATEIDLIPFLTDEATSEHEARFKDVYAWIRGKAQASSSQNAVKMYTDYAGQILKQAHAMVAEDGAKIPFVDWINARAGMRIFSTSDFQIEHSFDLAQALVDMHTVGMRAHAYTKEPRFVKIFGDTGIKIQMSVFAVEQADGTFKPDSHMGMAWEEAQSLREKHPNAGTVMVTTSDAMTKWALDQEWVDYIIPFHASGMPKAFFNDALNWQNFTSTQNEKSLEKGKKLERKTIMQEFAGVDGKPIKQLTKDYLALCKERGIKPVFAQYSDHPNFAKLRKDYARTDTPFTVPDPSKLNMAELRKQLDEYTLNGGRKVEADTAFVEKIAAEIKADPKAGTKALTGSDLRNATTEPAGQATDFTEAPQLSAKLNPKQKPKWTGWDDSDIRDAIVSEYLSGNHEHMPWRVVPAARVTKLWSDFSKSGVVRDEKGLYSVLDQLIENAQRLQFNNEISGHESYYPDNELESIFGDEPTDEEREALADWAIDTPDGGWRISDYGLPKIQQYLALAQEAPTPELALGYMDLALNVMHQRSDLAEWFVEGGQGTMAGISGEGALADMAPQFSAKTITVDGVERPTTNSDGRPIHPTEDGVRKFWEWFGKSKTVDKDGRPIVMYHGTVAGDMSRGINVFYTDATEMGLHVGTKAQSDVFSKWEYGTTYPLYVKAVKPLRLVDYGSFSTYQVLDQLVEKGIMSEYLARNEGLYKTAPDSETARKHTERLQKAVRNSGYDSIVYLNRRESEPGTFDEFQMDEGTINELDDDAVKAQYPELQDSYIVIDPRNVKSATGNFGMFNPADPDIEFSLKQTESPEFKKWFGDSKVVDENGDPLRVFHSTPADFTKFKHSSRDIGMHFGTIGQANDRYELQHEMDPYGAVLRGNKHNTIPVYLSIQNPLRLNDLGSWSAENVADALLRDYPGIFKGQVRRGAKLSELREVMKRQDYDGIVYKNTGETQGGAEMRAAEREARRKLEAVFPNKRSFSKEDQQHPAYQAHSAAQKTYSDFRNANAQDSYIVLDPKQVKSAIGNTGAFDASNPDIRFSIRTPGTAPEETRLQKAARKFQDRFNRVAELEKWAASEGVNLTEAAKAARALHTMNGKIAAQLQDFMDKEMGELLKDAGKAKVNLADIEKVMLAQHAAEANAQIQRLWNDPTRLAFGMSDADARQILATTSTSTRALAARFQALTKGTADLLLNNGIISQETRDAWDATYQNYVPLRGDGTDTQPAGTGRGNVINRSLKRRGGHESRNEAVIENIIKAREQAIRLVEKNKANLSLAKMILEIGDPSVGTVGRPVATKVFKTGRPQSMFVVYDNTGAMDFASTDRAAAEAHVNASPYKNILSIVEERDPMVTWKITPNLAPNEINAYVNGKQLRIQITDDVMAQVLTARGEEQLAFVFAYGKKINNWFSKAYTGYDPRFTIRNTIRDFTAGMVNLTGDYGAVIAAKIAANYPRAVYNFVRGGQWLEDYRKAGGSTGASYLSSLERIGETIESQYQEHLSAIQVYNQVYTDELQKGSSAMKSRTKALFKSGVAKFHSIPLIGHFLKAIEYMNAISENAFRLSTFITLREAGKSVGEAGAAAKNSTINFDKRGELGAQMGALYLFFNPAVQGIQRTFYALTQSEHKYQANAAAGMLAGLGFLAAEFARSLGGDDDEWDRIPRTVKNRNLVISVGGKQMITLPMPYEYGSFVGIGYAINDLVHGKFTDKSALNLASSILDGMMPLGNPVSEENGITAKSLTQMLPTLANILVAPARNTNTFGSPIQPEKYQEDKPSSQNMYRGPKGSVYATAAATINELTGGSAYEKGAVDISPEVLKFYTRTALGGALTFIDQVYMAGKIKVSGDELDLEEMPMVSVLARENTVRETRGEYYRIKSEAAAAAYAVAAARKAKDFDTASSLKAQYQGLIKVDKLADKMAKNIKAKRDLIDTIRLDDTLDFAEQRRQIRDVEERESVLYEKVIKAYGLNVKE
jgi:hypothetical protein